MNENESYLVSHYIHNSENSNVINEPSGLMCERACGENEQS